jgi:hypothetical protein
VKLTIALVLTVVLLFIGDWAYRGFLRPIDPLTPDVLALAEHFRSSGIEVRPYPVRNGFRHSVVTAAAAFEIKGYPLPVSIDVCPNAIVAATHLVNVARSPNLMGPMQNGRLVMFLPMWGDDTAAMAGKVHGAFSSFHDRT